MKVETLARESERNALTDETNQHHNDGATTMKKSSKPGHSASKSSPKRAALAKHTTSLTGARAAQWYGSSWIRRERRRAIYNRDSHTCVYCGCKSREGLTLDHVVPAESGGTNETNNLVTACRRCNSRKGAQSLRAFARTIASETNTTTRRVTDRVRKQLRTSIDVASAKAQLTNEREEREEREAIASAACTLVTAYPEEAFSFEFAA